MNNNEQNNSSKLAQWRNILESLRDTTGMSFQEVSEYTDLAYNEEGAAVYLKLSRNPVHRLHRSARMIRVRRISPGERLPAIHPRADRLRVSHLRAGRPAQASQVVRAVETATKAGSPIRMMNILTDKK